MALGLLCLIGLRLLPAIWSGTLVQFFLGFLGMPRRYHPGAATQPVTFDLTDVDWLVMVIVFLSCALFFIDVFQMIRKLRKR